MRRLPVQPDRNVAALACAGGVEFRGQARGQRRRWRRRRRRIVAARCQAFRRQCRLEAQFRERFVGAADIGVAAAEQPSTDIAAADITAADVAAPEAAAADVAAPDVATANVAAPDIAAPDVTTPDVAASDVPAPDVERQGTDGQSPLAVDVITADRTPAAQLVQSKREPV